jgi:hypothetical protein
LSAKDGRERLDKVLDAFFSTQPSYVTDKGRAVRERNGNVKVVEINGVPVCDVDFL